MDNNWIKQVGRGITRVMVIAGGIIIIWAVFQSILVFLDI